MSTIENEIYGVKWLKCVHCSLIAPDVKTYDGDARPRCPSIDRCIAVRTGQPLGGAPLKEWKK